MLCDDIKGWVGAVGESKDLHPDWETLSSLPKWGGCHSEGLTMGVRTMAPWEPACEAPQFRPKNTGMVGTVLTREAGPGLKWRMQEEEQVLWGGMVIWRLVECEVWWIIQVERSNA